MKKTLASLLVLTGCASVPSEIQGKFTAAADHGDGHGWYKEYIVDGDGFEMSGYPPITESCDLEHLSTNDSVHTLRATDCTWGSESADDRDIEVEVIEGGIRWDGQELQRSR